MTSGQDKLNLGEQALTFFLHHLTKSNRGIEWAVIKAQLITAIINGAAKQGMTHAELAKRSDLPRTL